jgi:ABC-type transport system involved in multi-copper enzyme maturation permease subunit
MNQTLVIARREIVEKKFVLAAAVAFAVLPFLLLLLPGARRNSHEVTRIAATIFAVGFTAGFAAILGASFVGRDVAEGRMSFFFARPVTAAAIYFGKLTASLLLIVSAFLIIITPAIASDPKAFADVWSANGRAVAITILTISLGLFVISHVIGTFVRSRSPLVALDFVLAFGVGVAVWALLRPMIQAGAAQIVLWMTSGLAAGAILSVLAGGAWQVANGRIDRKRNHYELSRFLWPALAVVLLLAAAYEAWVTHPSPNDLTDLSAEEAPGGKYAIVAGPARHRADYAPVFLIDTATGQFDRLTAGWNWTDDFTRDGSKLVIARPIGRGASDLFVRDVASGVEHETGLTIPKGDIIVNDDASRIATVTGGTVAVFDVATRHSLATARITDDGRLIRGVYFSDRDTVRVYWEPTSVQNGVIQQRTIRISEIDLKSRAVRETGSVSIRGGYIFAITDGNGSRLRVRDGDDLVIADGRTGAPIARVSPAAGAHFGSATFLTGGGIAVSEIGNDRAALRVFNDDGSPRASIDLGGDVRGIFPVREMVKGRVMASFSRRSGGWAAVLIDVDRGAVIEQHPMRSLAGNEWGRSSRDVRIGPAGPAMLFRDGRKLMQWNAVTNEKRVLLTVGG